MQYSTSIIAILAFILSLSGCAAKRLDIGAEILNVKSGYNEKIISINDGFEGEVLAVVAIFKDNHLSLGITNLSSKKTLIHWNESALIGTDGRTHKIYFATAEDLVKITNQNTNSNPAPTILTGGSKIVGGVFNMDNETLIPGSTSSGYLMQTSNNNYHYMPGYSTRDSYVNEGIVRRNRKLEITDEINANMNKIIELMLAVENNGHKSDYIIEFKINHVGVR